MPVPSHRSRNRSELRATLWRRLAGVALVVVAATGLTGCFTADVRLTVTADDTVSGEAVVAVDRAVVERSGSVTDVVADLVRDVLPTDPPSGSVTISPYEDPDRVGVTVALADVGLEAFSGATDGAAPVLQITRDDDHYLVSGRVDLTWQSLKVEDDPKAQQLLAEATVSLQLTFPGPVVTTNGSIDDADRNRVAWDLPMGETSDLQAVAETAPSPNSMLFAAATGVLLLAGVGTAIALLLRRRRGHGRHAHRPSDG
jgi:hypothetical protein